MAATRIASSQLKDADITDEDIATANKDGAAGTASMRTLGTGAAQAAAGDDARLTDARTPTAHASTHKPDGSDPLTVSVATRAAAAIDTAYQPSTTRDVQVTVSVEISTGTAGDGKLELLIDSANPPTTVRGTFHVATALTVIGSQLVGIVPAGQYWKLLKTDVGGTPTYSIVGDVQEVAL